MSATGWVICILNEYKGIKELNWEDSWQRLCLWQCFLKLTHCHQTFLPHKALLFVISLHLSLLWFITHDFLSVICLKQESIVIYNIYADFPFRSLLWSKKVQRLPIYFHQVNFFYFPQTILYWLFNQISSIYFHPVSCINSFSQQTYLILAESMRICLELTLRKGPLQK